MVLSDFILSKICNFAVNLLGQAVSTESVVIVSGLAKQFTSMATFPDESDDVRREDRRSGDSLIRYDFSDGVMHFSSQ